MFISVIDLDISKCDFETLNNVIPGFNHVTCEQVILLTCCGFDNLPPCLPCRPKFQHSWTTGNPPHDLILNGPKCSRSVPILNGPKRSVSLNLLS